MGDLRCLTIRAPYPHLIAHGIKHWETRSRRTNWRGPVAIHAGMRWEKGWRGVWVDPHSDGPDVDRYWLLTEKLGLEPTEDINGSDYWTAWGRLPLGAVVAVADLIDCVPITTEDAPVSPTPPCIDVDLAAQTLYLWEGDMDPSRSIDDQYPYGHWEPGNWAWQFDSIRRLAEPVPAKGRLGLWRPDADLTAAIEAALPETAA